MQASNKSDVTQVYESATRATKTGLKDSIKYGFRYFLKPLTIFSYHYFVEGIRAVQKDVPTKELEKLTNLSYDETIKIMEKCQKDGIRVVASERKLSTEDSEFGKKKSLHKQKRITRYSRRVKNMSDFKAHYPKVAKLLLIDKLIQRNQEKQNNAVEHHKDKRYNLYYNKSKSAYMGDRIADLIEYRTGLSKKLFDENTQAAIEEIKKDGISNLNSEQLRKLSDKFKLHEIGNVNTQEFKQDYCIHTIPFSAFLRIEDELEVADIPYGIKVVTDDEEKKVANIYFENKNLERYNELGFNNYGQIHVYGNNNKNMQWDIKSQDELVSFSTKVGDEEKQTYETLSGKNYIMKRQENECLWTVFKADLKDLAEKEKKRDVVGEELERLHIFEQLEKDANNSPTIADNPKEIEVTFDNEIEKEAGD